MLNNLLSLGKIFGLVLLVCGVLGASALELHAHGAFSTTPNGDPVRWVDGDVTYRQDPGGGDGDSVDGGGSCSLIHEAKAFTFKGLDFSAIVDDAFQNWGDQTGGLNITRESDLSEPVTLANVENFYVGGFSSFPGASGTTADPCYNGDTANCLNPIIFDDSGLITDAILGACARYSVFGFASILPLTNGSGEITDSGLRAAQMVVSGSCVAPVDAADSNCFGSGFGQSCPVELDQSGITGVITHEIGHFLGLDHTMAVKDTYLDCTAVGADCSAEELELVPTMIGLFVPGADLGTLAADDIAGINALYPDPANNTCAITGTVRTFDNNNGRCVEVVASRVGDSTVNVSTVSGATVPRNSQGQSCQNSANPNAASYSDCVNSPNAADLLKVHTNCSTAADNCGQFEIGGLTSGEYQLSLRTFKSANSGSAPSIPFVIEPCDQVRNQDSLDDNLSPLGAPVMLNCPTDQNVGVINTN